MYIIGIEEVECDSFEYDISVENNENFYANNILVHNCRALITHSQNGEVVIRTRNGNRIISLECMDEDFKKALRPNETWDGELLYFNGDKPASRKVSNGILNKAIRNTITPKEAANVKFVAWDIVDTTKSIPYKTRFSEIVLRLTEPNPRIRIVEYCSVNTMDEVTELFIRALDSGEEGIIAKNKDAVWEPKRSKNMIKFKEEKTADLVVVDWEEGTGKHKGRLGALVCESSDGLIKVNIGSGYSDIQRNEFTPDIMIGKIVEVKYNSRISKKDKPVDSLYLGRFIKIREDKNEANSSEEIV